VQVPTPGALHQGGPVGCGCCCCCCWNAEGGACCTPPAAAVAGEVWRLAEGCRWFLWPWWWRWCLLPHPHCCSCWRCPWLAWGCCAPVARGMARVRVTAGASAGHIMLRERAAVYSVRANW